jgi:hypothetical protein
MKLPCRRQLLHLAVGAAALPTLSRIARAQAYPSRLVRIFVGFPPGGAADTVVRIIAQWLSDRLRQFFCHCSNRGLIVKNAQCRKEHLFSSRQFLRSFL